MSSWVTWYVGDFSERLLNTCCINPTGKYFGIYIATVVGIDTGLAALNRYAPASFSAGHIGRMIHIQELGPGRKSVRGVRSGAGANCELRARLVPRWVFRLKSTSQVPQIRSQYLNPGNYRAFSLIQSSTIT